MFSEDLLTFTVKSEVETDLCDDKFHAFIQKCTKRLTSEVIKVTYCDKF